MDQQGNIKTDHVNEDLTSRSLSAKLAVTDAVLRAKKENRFNMKNIEQHIFEMKHLLWTFYSK